MLASPLPLRRVNGFLVVRLRMNWTVGGKSTLSPALAERIMDALEDTAFASRPRLHPVPLCGLRVARGHRGGDWRGILGSSWKAIKLRSVHWPGLVWCARGGQGRSLLLAAPVQEASVSAPCVGAREGLWRSPSPWLPAGRFCTPGGMGSSQLGEGCSWHLVGRS